MLETLATSVLRHLYWAIPAGILVMGYFVLRNLYCPRTTTEWKKLTTDPAGRAHLRERKKRLDAIRSRKPGSILPGILTSERDFALEPLIRNRKFREAKAYIMEQIRRIRQSPEPSSRIRVYIQYLELIDGTH